MLPFTHEQFLAVFAAYNAAVWPAQWIAYALGAWIVAALVRTDAGDSAWIGAPLAMLWAWTGIAYHALFFSGINPLAFVFAAAFIAQSALFAWDAARGRLQVEAHPGPVRRSAAWTLIAYASIAYPLLGMLGGMRYPALPTFGITPCPLTLFTLGVLLLLREPPRRLLAIPIAWSLVGGSAAVLLDVPQDWPLLVSGAAAWVLLQQGRRASPA